MNWGHFGVHFAHFFFCHGISFFSFGGVEALLFVAFDLFGQKRSSLTSSFSLRVVVCFSGCDCFQCLLSSTKAR